jgi:hypothetical protein
MLCCIIGIVVVFACDAANHYSLAVSRQEAASTIYTYKEQVVGYLAAGLVMTTSAVNSLVYQPEGTMEAAAAGFILLSIVAVRNSPCQYCQPC